MAGRSTGVIVFADGRVVCGQGFGAQGAMVGEICFNTAMTGYQEILTDPSYAGQIVTFTFPHIGNVGANYEDFENGAPDNHNGRSMVRGCITRCPVTPASNFRSEQQFDVWLEQHQVIGVNGIDTRALTNLIRRKGAINAAIAHERTGRFDFDQLKQMAAQWSGLKGMDLSNEVSCAKPYVWDKMRWRLGQGYRPQAQGNGNYHVGVIDFGVKRNILCCLAELDCRVTVFPPKFCAEEILAIGLDGVLLSNGPGDPKAVADHCLGEIKQLIIAGLPIFGICLGHQLLALAFGARTLKMHQGHHGANHPLKNGLTGRAEITSMNHGFAVDAQDLSAGIEQTHISLFDGTNCGLRALNKPVFSVQHHPEASPGPQDSIYIFEQFVAMMANNRDKR